MKAKTLSGCGSSPAPKSWTEIPEIAAARPARFGVEISLQKIDGLNICVWMIGWGGEWQVFSEYFRVW